VVPRVFDRTSPVTVYWLTRCKGFEVRGRGRVGRVEAILFDDDPLKPVALRVRSRLGAARTIAVEAIAATCPRERVLYADRRRTIAPATRWIARRLAAVPVFGVRTVASALTGLWVAIAPRLQLAARSTATAAVAGARRSSPHVARGIRLAAEVACFAAAVVGELLVRVAIAAGRGLRRGTAFTIRRGRAALPELGALGAGLRDQLGVMSVGGDPSFRRTSMFHRRRSR
jgi:hypothetical protein